MNQNKLAILKEKLGVLEQSAAWLKRSYNQCASIGVKEKYSTEEFDCFENLTSRYTGTTDMFINQALRCLDTVRGQRQHHRYNEPGGKARHC